MWVDNVYNEYLSINSTICHFSCPDILLNLNNILLNPASAEGGASSYAGGTRHCYFNKKS
jgi:hypothetical protein